MKSTLFLATLLAAPLLGSTPDRPNVLFVVFDDLRTNLGCYGDPVAVTPHLDRLAARGTVFTRAYAQMAVCNPSRASALTGRRPDAIKVWDLRTHFRQNVPDVVTLPQYFKNHGFHTEAIGKIYHDPASFRDPPSWSVPAQLDDTREVRGKYASAENLQIYQPNGRMGEEKAAATEAADVPDQAYIDGRVAGRAIERLRALAAGHQPFFLAVGIRRPHLPFSAPQRYWDLYDAARLATVAQPEPPRAAPPLALHDSVELRGYTDMPSKGPFSREQVTRLRHGYYAATSFADAQFGRLLAELEAQRLDRNTIVVVWSDHGFHLGEHALWTKTTNYEADTRVPLIIATADGRRRGVRTDAIVELLDLYPTLAELCGLPPPAHVDGRSLAASIGDPSRAARQGALSQFPRPWGMGNAKFQYMGYAVRTATHRYVEWRLAGTADVAARELYFYDGDELFERENLAADPAHRRTGAELAALLGRVMDGRER